MVDEESIREPRQTALAFENYSTAGGRDADRCGQPAALKQPIAPQAMWRAAVFGAESRS